MTHPAEIVREQQSKWGITTRSKTEGSWWQTRSFGQLIRFAASDVGPGATLASGLSQTDSRK